ncbi:MAG: transcription termination factor NusA, partial [bacterium]
IVEDAIARAFQTESEGLQSVRVEFDPEEGSLDIFRVCEVVSEVENPDLEISLEEAKEIAPDAELGELVEREISLANFRRIGIQTVKQHIVQRIREIEREAQLGRFEDKVGDIVSGTVARINNQGVMINLGRIDGFMPNSERIAGERYVLGKRVRAYVKEVKTGLKDSDIILSRACPDFVHKLFALEVPEVAQRIVEIKKLVREAGYRTKMSVISNQEKVDPVGACVGHKGQRVKNIVNELSGEKIDIIPWSENPAQFIASSLSPAQVISVEIFEEDNSVEVIVPDSQLSLAIGKGGQNARLANKLTGWKIDILSEEEKEKLARELSTARLLEGDVEALGFSRRVTNLLVENGMKTVNDLIRKTSEELREMPGFGDKSVEEIQGRLDEFELSFSKESAPPAKDAPEAAVAVGAEKDKPSAEGGEESEDSE